MFKESPALENLLTKIHSGDIIDYKQPLTSIAEMKRLIENEFILDEKFAELVAKQFTETLSNPENIKKNIVDNLISFQDKIKIRNNENQAFQQLLQLFKNIDSISIGKTVNLIDTIGILGSNNEIIEATSFVRELEELTGEQLARKLITIMPSLIETSYKRYLSFLVLAKYALSNTNKQADSKLGVMMEQARSLEQNYPLLIDFDIAWLRNSTAHNNWRYEVESNSIVMWDDKHPEVLFPIEVIVSKILEAYHTSSMVFFDACSYYKANYLDSSIRSQDMNAQ